MRRPRGPFGHVSARQTSLEICLRVHRRLLPPALLVTSDTGPSANPRGIRLRDPPQPPRLRLVAPAPQDCCQARAPYRLGVVLRSHGVVWLNRGAGHDGEVSSTGLFDGCGGKDTERRGSPRAARPFRPPCCTAQFGVRHRHVSAAVPGVPKSPSISGAC
jgi:hypothetical protein